MGLKAFGSGYGHWEASLKPACHVGFTDSRRFGSGEMDDSRKQGFASLYTPTLTMRETLMRQ